MKNLSIYLVFVREAPRFARDATPGSVVVRKPLSLIGMAIMGVAVMQWLSDSGRIAFDHRQSAL